MKKNLFSGHLAALFAAFVWGTTFIVTKDLMNDFNASEILFVRFVIAVVVLTFVCLIKKERLRMPENKKDELYFAGAGLTGLFLYGVFEILSMKYTYASNTSTIVSTNPFFTSLFVILFLKGKRPKSTFYIGFAIAIIGIAVISFNGTKSFGLNPLGDFLALVASVSWGFYTVLISKAYDKGYSTLYITRRTYIWGVFEMLLSMPFFGLEGGFERLASLQTIGGFIFLGIIASGCCFMTWNYATKSLGPISSSVYIYTIPVITIIFASIFSQEVMNATSLLGIAIVIAGTVISSIN